MLIINLYAPELLQNKQKIKSRIATVKTTFDRKKTLFTSKMDLNLRKKIVNCYTWSTTLHGTENWTLWKRDQKYLVSSEM
jgi:hypothetical protein